MQSTAQKTEAYIDEHPHIRHCLQQDLLNYSALARKIAADLDIEKSSSIEAILIAARRYQEKLGTPNIGEVHKVLQQSELQVRNKMAVLIAEKTINFDAIEHVQKDVRAASGIMYVLEGSESYTIILSESFAKALEQQIKSKLIKVTRDVALVNVKAPKEIETTPGVTAYLTSLFAENGINIYEILSCWTDQLFIVDAKQVPKLMDVLQF